MSVLHRAAAQRGLDDFRAIPLEPGADEGCAHGQHSLISLSEVLSDFRAIEQARSVFDLASRWLAQSVALVFSVFPPRDGDAVSDAARELGQRVRTSIFTRDGLTPVAAGLNFQPVSDGSAHGHEKANLAAGGLARRPGPGTRRLRHHPRGVSHRDARWPVCRRRGWRHSPVSHSTPVAARFSTPNCPTRPPWATG